MKFRYATLAAGAVALAVSTAAQAAPTATMGLVYIGSSNTDVIAPGSQDPTTVIQGGGIVANPNLTVLTNAQLSDPSFETSAWRHYYAAVITFTPDAGNTVERLKAATFSISVGGNLQVVSADQTDNTFLTRYYGYSNITTTGNAAEFTSNGDGGTDGDLQDILVQLQNATVPDYTKAKNTNVGIGGTNNIRVDSVLASQPVPSPLGVFAVSFTSPGAGSLTIGGGNGANFSYYSTTGGGAATLSTGLTGGTFTVGAAVPEPASLGLLTLGGLALLARRRKVKA